MQLEGGTSMGPSMCPVGDDPRLDEWDSLVNQWGVGGGLGSKWGGNKTSGRRRQTSR